MDVYERRLKLRNSLGRRNIHHLECVMFISTNILLLSVLCIDNSYISKQSSYPPLLTNGKYCVRFVARIIQMYHVTFHKKHKCMCKCDVTMKVKTENTELSYYIIPHIFMYIYVIWYIFSAWIRGLAVRAPLGSIPYITLLSIPPEPVLKMGQQMSGSDSANG